MRILDPTTIELTSVDLASIRQESLKYAVPIVETPKPPSGVRELTHYHPDWGKSPNVGRTQQLRIDRARYAKLEDSFRVRLQRSWRRMQSGDLTQPDFAKWFNQELHQFQVASYLLGKRAGGDFSTKLTQEEKRWLHGQHSSELRYFQNLLKNGRRVMRLDQRLDLYALGSFGIYARGYLEAIEKKAPDTKWDYRLSDSEHCDDCVKKRKLCIELGGFTLKKLLEVGLPSEKCACLHRCRCYLVEMVDGRSAKVFRTRSTSFKWLRSRIEP